jgi:hypothetical protein
MHHLQELWNAFWQFPLVLHWCILIGDQQRDDHGKFEILDAASRILKQMIDHSKDKSPPTATQGSTGTLCWLLGMCHFDGGGQDDDTSQ